MKEEEQSKKKEKEALIDDLVGTFCVSVLGCWWHKSLSNHILIQYCSSVWDNLGKVLGRKLQKLQNRAARIIIGSDYNVHSGQTLNSLNWDNLEKRRSQQFGS